jgi:hypothetical protein
MAVDYLKNYLNIDPNDYSAMESRIRGDEPPAQSPLMMRQLMMMPQQRSLGDISAMPMMPRQQPVQQNDSKYDGLMAEIASLKAQIDALQTPVVEEAPVMAEQAPVMASTPTVMSEPYQAPVGIENRAVGEPQPMPYIDPYKQGDNYVTDDAIYNPTGGRNVFEEAKAPSQDIQQSIDYLAKLPKMNIPQIPDMEEIKRKMAEANMSFPEPVSYQDQLQSIRDIPQPNLPNNFMGNSARNVMSQIQQPQMQSVGRPSTRLAGGFIPEMRAGGGGIDKAIYDLKFKLNG